VLVIITAVKNLPLHALLTQKGFPEGHWEHEPPDTYGSCPLKLPLSEKRS